MKYNYSSVNNDIDIFENYSKVEPIIENMEQPNEEIDQEEVIEENISEENISEDINIINNSNEQIESEIVIANQTNPTVEEEEKGGGLTIKNILLLVVLFLVLTKLTKK